MSPLRVLRGLIFGAIGGLIGWILIEQLPLGPAFQPWRYESVHSIQPVISTGDQAMLGVALGLAIGGCLGVAEGMGEGTVSRFRRTLLAFLGLGALGGMIGLYFGQTFFAIMHGKTNPGEIGVSDFLPQLLARSMGWMLLGLFLGVVFGVSNMSFRRAWNGALGGAIGGALGGFVFQVLAYAGFGGTKLRLLGFVILGAAIGFFINLVAEVMKRVWVKVLIGRNEGREYVLDTPLAYVGRDELAQIPVFLDPAVPKRMASFRLTSGRYALYPESNALPMTVNGQPVQPGHVLRDGDAIQFGRVTLGYNEKATATGSTRPVDNVPLADFSAPSVVPGAVPIPNNPNVCSFCGQPRDAAGNCACSVGADPGYGSGAPGYAPGGYDPAYSQPGYGQPTYGATQAYGAPTTYDQGGYGAPAGYGTANGDAAYAPTMMDSGMGYGGEAADGPRLVAVAGPLAGQVFPLQTEETGIGRDPGQEIPLPGDTTASRRHARVIYAPTGWFVRDEGSSNGTFVNGVRVQEQPIMSGDTIRVGQSQFRFDG